MKKILSLLFIIPFLFSYIYANEIYSYKEAIPIAEGITLYKATEFYSKYNISYSYIEADLTNKNIGLTLLKSDKGMDFSDTNFNLASTEENVVASLNADFFSNVGDKTISLGVEIKDGNMLQSPINPDTMATVAVTDDNISMSYLDFHIMVVAPNWEFAEVRHLNKHTSYYGDILMFTKEFNGGFSLAPGGEVVEVVVEDGIVTEFRRNMPPCEIPENGCVLAVSEGNSMFFSNNFKVGDEIKFDYYITPDISSSDIAFGGGAILVSEGKALTSFSHNIIGNNPRSAIGISEDGKKLYLVAVNGRQTMSHGMSMADLAVFMEKLGCHTAVNLDGGGSTNMQASTVWNGKIHTVNSPTENRKVINAVGITYENEDAAKAPYGIILENEKNTVFIGEQVKISSALYTKDKRPAEGKITWSATNGSVKDGFFTAEKGGKAKITAKSGKAKATTEIFVVDEIAGIETESRLKLSPGDSNPLSLNVFDSEGHYVSVKNTKPFTFISSNPEVVSVENGKVIALRSGTAVISVSKDDAKSFISVIVGEDKETFTLEFEEETGSFAAYPDYVKGDFYITDENVISGGYSGALSYDFTEDTEDSKAVYLTLTEPVVLSPYAEEISLSLFTENDFPHELRALLSDADGKDVRIVFGSNFESGNTYSLSAQLPEDAKTPLMLKRIYALYQAEEEKDSGILYIDDLTSEKAIPFTYPDIPDNIYADPVNVSGDGEKLSVVSPSSEKDTLIAKFLDIELMKEVRESDYGMLAGKDNKFSATEEGSSLFITLNTQKSGIRATDSSQWNKLKAAVEESDASYLFITTNAPIFGKDEFENQVLKDYLSTLDKEVFVIENGTKKELKIIDGVRYLTLPHPDSSLSLNERIDAVELLEFYIGDSVTYTYKKLYE